jgi:NADH dehydrogenase
VVIGGGFAGLEAAKRLSRAPVDLVLLDRRNHHLFQPLLYQVAVGALNPADIAAPIRHVLRRQTNATVLLGDAMAVDLEAKQVRLSDGARLSYDYLVVATGATHAYFGNDDWASHAPGLKSIEDALEIRKRIFLAYEAAERESDPARRQAWMSFVIVGAGPTGVELAGALAEIARHTLRDEFRLIDPRLARVLLVEAQDRILPPYPAELSAAAERSLQRLCVEVKTGRPVEAIDDEGVTIAGERVAARTVIWAAGVAASPLARSLRVPLDGAGRVRVRSDLSIPTRGDVFVIGDLAAVEQDGRPVPGVSPAAIQAGRHAARNIRRRLAGKPSQPFRYRDKGSFAVIGRGAAVGDILGRWRLSGLSAWVAWLGIHLYFLVGFRNRVIVMVQWAWSFFTLKLGVRLITTDVPRTGASSAPSQP